MSTICIGYLTDNRRTYTFDKFVYFLDKITNKQKIHLVILINNISNLLNYISLDSIKQKVN